MTLSWIPVFLKTDMRSLPPSWPSPTSSPAPATAGRPAPCIWGVATPAPSPPPRHNAELRRRQRHLALILSATGLTPPPPASSHIRFRRKWLPVVDRCPQEATNLPHGFPVCPRPPHMGEITIKGGSDSMRHRHFAAATPLSWFPISTLSKRILCYHSSPRTPLVRPWPH